MKLALKVSGTILLAALFSSPAIANATTDNILPARDFSPHSVSSEQDRTGNLPPRSGNPTPETGLDRETKQLPARSGNPTGSVSTEQEDNNLLPRDFSPAPETNID